MEFSQVYKNIIIIYYYFLIQVPTQTIWDQVDPPPRLRFCFFGFFLILMCSAGEYFYWELICTSTYFIYSFLSSLKPTACILSYFSYTWTLGIFLTLKILQGHYFPVEENAP